MSLQLHLSTCPYRPLNATRILCALASWRFEVIVTAMIDVYREIVRLQELGQRAALATVVLTRGSTPRKAGAQMLVREDGFFIGSISGGCIEAEVYDLAKETLKTGKPQVFETTLTEEQVGVLGLTCGGLIKVFIERV